MSINWEGDGNDVAGDFSPIPEAKYLLRVDKATEGTTKKGTPKMDLEFVVSFGAYVGRRIWHTLAFIPKGEPGHGLTVQAVKALGLWRDGPLSLEADDFLGRECEAKVEVNTYTDNDGKERKNNRIATAGFVTEDKPASGTPAAKPAPRPAPVAKKDAVPF